MIAIPGFTLIKKIQANGPGEVWWASSEHADQLVTLHFLTLDSPAKPEDQQRFMREAALCAQMQHPGLVRFLAQGITGNTLWFATELVDSSSLQQFIAKRGPLTTDDAINVLDQTLEIVIYLHQQDVVHRSLHTQSLLVEKQAGALTVRLADLGSAKCFQVAELHPITKLGERGYPIHCFTAPEALLDFAKLDARSDIYALGAILYFVLTGHPPYEVSSEDDLELTILEIDPPPLLTLKSDLSPTIANVVERAMSRNIEARYQTAQEMHTALHGAGKPVESSLINEIEWLRIQLIQHHANLLKLEEQVAIFGAGLAPLHLLNQIEAEREAISRLEERLQALGT